MTDITKCTGEKDGKVCPLRKTCYRFTAPTGTMQSFFREAPLKEDGTCDHFLGDK